MNCRICGNGSSNRLIQAREMLFGTMQSFDYIECRNCGTVQITEIPADLSSHYRSDYYSFEPIRLKKNRLRTLLRRCRVRHYLGLPDFLGRLTSRGSASRPGFLRFLCSAHADPDTSILDVGCGSGSLLAQLYQFGFKNLTGIDPFLPRDIQYDRCFRVFRREIGEESGRYGLVMMHHSLEHMKDPREVLGKAKDLLEPGGTLLVRVPLAGTYAWRTYGRDWVQLDAPRHLHLFTERSLRLMAMETGLHVKECVYDSEAIQFWGSEQNKRNVPLLSPQSYGIDPAHSIFSNEEILAFQQEADRLNRAGDGDQAMFFLESC